MTTENPRDGRCAGAQAAGEVQHAPAGLQPHGATQPVGGAQAARMQAVAQDEAGQLG